MSKIFRRPMFRKGGGANMNGIMSGITDREMHAESNPDGVGNTGFISSSFEELQPQYLEKLKEATSESQSFDPLTKFLLTFGPAYASQRPVGSGFAGAIATAAEASKPAFKDMFEEAAAKKKFEKELAAGATELAIGQAGKERLLEKQLAAEKEIAAMKTGLKAEDLVDLSQYGSAFIAQNRKDYEEKGLEQKAKEVFKGSYEGLIGSVHGYSEKELKDTPLKWKKNNLGKIFYDVTDGNFKQLLQTTEDGWGYKLIDIDKYAPPKEDNGDELKLTEYQKDILKKIEENRKIKEEEEKQKRIKLLQSLPTIPSYLD